ncbi:hypothetical protein HII13_003192 [Brettanomyces bruxellensis]|nr:hypothetical protein HII13_003192 [Brettanomyces bruxellensis]
MSDSFAPDAAVTNRSLPCIINQCEITDRFIPQIKDHMDIFVKSHLPDFAYERTRKKADAQTQGSALSLYQPQLFMLQNEHFLVTPNIEPINFSQRLIISQNESVVSNKTRELKCPLKFHGTQREQIATALGFDCSRILSFRTKRNTSKYKSSIQFPGLSSKFIKKDDYLKHNKNETAVLKDIAFKVLDAPGLRNDYYSNTVCWSKDSSILAVGLGSSLYTWSEGTGTLAMQKLNNEMISSMSYNYGGILALGTKGGNIAVYDKGSRLISDTCIFRSKTGISCIKWLHNQEYFFAGNDTGEIGLFEFRKAISNTPGGTEYNLVKLATFSCNRQQICGIDVNYKNTQMAVGCNENKCTIYDISIPTRIVRMHSLEHKAAVKAVAFCPWMPTLLATGGGSKDRSIRFWHTTSGTLVKCFETKGQITSLIWSTFKKELLATFGFGSSGSENILIEVYLYPSMKLVKRVESISDMRVLTADLSNDHKSICTGLSDQSVRIYSIWNANVSIKTGVYDKDIFESKLIELAEGINYNYEDIR